MAYIRIPRNNKNVTCNCIPNCFYFAFWLRSTGRNVQTYERFFLSTFSRLGHFPLVFGQVKESHILEFHDTIRVPYLGACPIVFILFYAQGWQGGVFETMKNDHFLVILAVLVLFPKFLGRLRSSFY